MFNPDMERIKEVSGLIGDLASKYQQPQYYELQEIKEIVEFLKNSPDEEANQIAEWIVNCITHAMSS
jgi:hypothetical protein